MQLLLADPRTAVNQATTDDGFTPLLIAAHNGHAECVQLLVGDPRTAVNQAMTDEYGYSPLSMAAHNGHAECVRLLLGDPRTAVNQATTDEYGSTPLFMAVGNGHAECVRLLLGDPRTAVNQATTDDGATPLHAAAQDGHYACVELLLAETCTRVNIATLHDKETPLIVAAHNGHASVVDLILIDDIPSLARHFSSWRGLVVAGLLCNMALPSCLPVLVWKFIFSFLRPRTEVNATLRRDGELTEWALEAGLVSGASALWLAAARGHTAVVELLLAREGVAVDQPDMTGRTPLLIAQEREHPGCVALLESHIAALNRRPRLR
jgi:serine/threonine-protein phosphatase 6 regulatory ankyrin repeat subunit A